MTARTRFVVVLEGPAGADDGAHLRTLRFLLKHLLRARSLRCVDAREVRDGVRGRDDVDDGGSS